jgi:hypothetical protein
MEHITESAALALGRCGFTAQLCGIFSFELKWAHCTAVSQFCHNTDEEHEVLFPFQAGAVWDRLVAVVADHMFWTRLYALAQACLGISVLWLCSVELWRGECAHVTGCTLLYLHSDWNQTSDFGFKEMKAVFRLKLLSHSESDLLDVVYFHQNQKCWNIYTRLVHLHLL